MNEQRKQFLETESTPGEDATVAVFQSLSCVQLFVNPWTPARQASLSFTLSEFAQTHVHWVDDVIKIVEMTITVLEYVINWVDKVASEFEKIDSNFERRSPLG